MARASLAAVAAGYVAWRILRVGRRFDFRQASVLITGGSRGLGLELARLFAAEGAKLTLLARDPEELERARRELSDHEGDVLVRTCDVGDREDAERAIDFVVKTRGRIDVLINNAGIVQVGPWEHMALEDFEEAMAVHAWGPLYLIRAAVPHMRGEGGGRIVNISSIGGLVAVPHILPYSMSKFALTGLSDGVRAELAKDGIRVTTVAPGLMRTGSHVNAFTKGQHEKEFAWFAAGAGLLSTSSRHAARRILEACRYGEARVVLTPQARLLQAANSLLPGLTAAGMILASRLLPGPTGRAGDRVRRGWESVSGLAPSFLTRRADRAIARNNESGWASASPRSPQEVKAPL